MSESEFSDSQTSEYLSEHDSDRDFIDDDQSQNPESEFESSNSPSLEDSSDPASDDDQ
jgi:hypothetical protein